MGYSSVSNLECWRSKWRTLCKPERKNRRTLCKPVWKNRRTLKCVKSVQWICRGDDTSHWTFWTYVTASGEVKKVMLFGERFVHRESFRPALRGPGNRKLDHLWDRGQPVRSPAFPTARPEYPRWTMTYGSSDALEEPQY